MTPPHTSTADRRAALGDEISVALHSLNNALAAALGRLEMCRDCLDDDGRGAKDVLRECLFEAERSLLHARDHATEIATLTIGSAA